MYKTLLTNIRLRLGYLEHTEKQFSSIGGEFVTPIATLKEKLRRVKAFIFDWDGVFNNGYKTGNEGSLFSEVDAMGTNMLRFNYYLQKQYNLPYVFIITGMQNQLAWKLAEREKFHKVIYNAKFKKQALDMLCTEYKLEYKNFAFFYDDVLDLELVKQCGVTFQVTRKANPLFNHYTLKNKICDYMTGHSGNEHGLREACELIIGLTGDYTTTVEKRVAFKGDYENYLAHRQKTITEFIDLKPVVLK